MKKIQVKTFGRWRDHKHMSLISQQYEDTRLVNDEQKVCNCRGNLNANNPDLPCSSCGGLNKVINKVWVCTTEDGGMACGGCSRCKPKVEKLDWKHTIGSLEEITVVHRQKINEIIEVLNKR